MSLARERFGGRYQRAGPYDLVTYVVVAAAICALSTLDGFKSEHIVAAFGSFLFGSGYSWWRDTGDPDAFFDGLLNANVLCGVLLLVGLSFSSH